MVSRATSADCDLLAAIHAASFDGPDAWSRDVFSLQLALPNVFGLLDSAGGMILVRVAADEAEILTLAVVPGLRCRGIGGRLMREAMTCVMALDVRTVFLEVSVTNDAARHLYSRAGFIQAGLRPRYYSDHSDALLLRTDLGAGGLTRG